MWLTDNPLCNYNSVPPSKLIPRWDTPRLNTEHCNCEALTGLERALRGNATFIVGVGRQQRQCPVRQERVCASGTLFTNVYRWTNVNCAKPGNYFLPKTIALKSCQLHVVDDYRWDGLHATKPMNWTENLKETSGARGLCLQLFWPVEHLVRHPPSCLALRVSHWCKIKRRLWEIDDQNRCWSAAV